MGVVIPDGFGQVRFQFDVPGRSGDVMIVSGYENSAFADGDTDAEAWGVFAEESFMESLSAACTLLGTTVVFNNFGDLIEGTYISGTPGEIAGDVMPPNNAVLIRKVTGLAGRQNRGRLYLPGIPKDDVNNAGLYEDTPRGVLQSNIDAQYATLNGTGLFFSILHDEDGPFAADTPPQVTQLPVEGKTATQRTRLRD